MSSDKVYEVFINRAQDALGLLDICGMTTESQSIKSYLKETENQTGGSHFEGTVNAFALCGFRLVYVLDNFERFTTSRQVTMEHHEKMRSLLDKTQYVVATNFDLNRDSLPPEVQSSYLLQMFADNEITLGGLSLEESEQYIRRELKKNDFEFPQSLIQELHAISGGIPKLLHNAAFHAYEYLEQEDLTSIKGTDIPKKIYGDMQKTMDNWRVLLTPNQVKVLKELKGKSGQPGELGDSAAQLLVQRGVLRPVCRVNERGRRIVETGVYDYNSVIFSTFCTKVDENGITLLEKATQKNPFLAEQVKSAELPVMPSAALSQVLTEQKTLAEAFKTGLPTGTIVVNGDVIMSGANKNNTEIHVEQMSLLQSMGDEKQFLTKVEQIMGRLAEDSRFVIDRNVSQEELDERYDEVADEIVGEIVPQLPSAEELQTLDERFREVRSRGVRTEITDTFLDALTDECQFYLKIAVVVEDALRILHTVNLGDFSAQLVMYGKVLEQCLRDNMHELFHTEKKLKIWDLYRHKEDDKSTQCFGSMQVTKTFIGNYLYMMRDKKNYLSQLCNNKAIESEEAQRKATGEWNQWWKALSEDVDAARECRNTEDHAGSKSDKDDLQIMCNLLFGDKGIMNRCRVAKKLCEKITL